MVEAERDKRELLVNDVADEVMRRLNSPNAKECHDEQ